MNFIFVSIVLVLIHAVVIPAMAKEVKIPLNEELNGDMNLCFEQSSVRYGLDVNLLIAIGKTESNFQANAINENANGTSDIGVMQINSFWWPVIQKWGFAVEDLFDPCVNIEIGAWILADAIHKYGETWRAVGSYHAGTGKNDEVELRRFRYVEKIRKNLDWMTMN